MIKVAVLLFAASLLVMYLTWRWGVRRQLMFRGLRTQNARFAMFRDALALYQDAKKGGILPICLKIFLMAAFVALVSLVVPTGRLILSNRHYIPNGEAPAAPAAESGR